MIRSHQIYRILSHGDGEERALSADERTSIESAYLSRRRNDYYKRGMESVGDIVQMSG